MGVSEAGESELIRVSVVDYFTGAILLDKLVYPDVKMKHYNTRYSGVSFRDMQTAVRKRTCLFGRAAARKAVWNCVGVDTIVVGHDAQSDLTSLRWIHPLVVDTFMVEEEIAREIKDKLTREANKRQEELDLKRLEAVARGEEPPPAAQSEEAAEIERRIKTEFGLSLKFLAKKRLDRTIQIKNQGHDSVEDALAARDILHWHLTNRVMEPVSY
jgi:RNA exonuclease 1